MPPPFLPALFTVCRNKSSFGYLLPLPQNAPIDGDGNLSAFRIKDGRADFKMKYVRTDRFKLEKAAGKALFGLYRNPYTHHPCVRAAVDSTANTNVVYWAGKLLALKEVSTRILYFASDLYFVSDSWSTLLPPLTRREIGAGRKSR